MRLRKVLPSMPWQIEQGYNDWRPIDDGMAKFLLEYENQTLLKAIENLRKVYNDSRKEVPDSGDIQQPTG